MEDVGRQPMPIAIGVVADMHETGKVGKEDGTPEADLLALVLIDRGQLGVMHRREEPDAQAGGPPAAPKPGPSRRGR
jgi:hypothetical protein